MSFCLNLNVFHVIRACKGAIFVKSNTKRFTEFTNFNLSRTLVKLTLLFFNDVKEHEFPSNGGVDFLCSHVSFTAAYSLKSDKLIVKDNCFVIEIFDKFSFNGIFRGCLSHLKETQKE